MFQIKFATNEEELEELYRFRYRIYVEEMGRTQHHADHTQRKIRDDLDEKGHNLLALSPKIGSVLGALRVNFTRNELIPYYEDFFFIHDQLGVSRSNASICTRLMVDKSVRKSSLAVRLFIHMYQFALTNGIRHNFIDCNDHLVGLFTSFGFINYMGTAIHKEYGKVSPMKLDLWDEDLFRRIGSPFLRPLLEWKCTESTPQTTDLFENFTENSQESTLYS
jgi:predicted GNAT family N-acyltransferase